MAMVTSTKTLRKLSTTTAVVALTGGLLAAGSAPAEAAVCNATGITGGDVGSTGSSGSSELGWGSLDFGSYRADGKKPQGPLPKLTGASKAISWVTGPRSPARTDTRFGITATDVGVPWDNGSGQILDNIAAHEHRLRDYASERLGGLNWLNLQGTAPGKGAIFSFTMEGPAHPHDISTVVDRKGVAVRAGHHCAQPLMEHLGVTATARASFGIYSDESDVAALVAGLSRVQRIFG